MKASKRTVLKVKASEAGMTPKKYKQLLRRLAKLKARGEEDTSLPF